MKRTVDPTQRSLWGTLLGTTVPRALALCLGLFVVGNVLGGWWVPGFDANVWWIDLRPVSPVWIDVLLAGAGIGLLVYGLGGRCRWYSTLAAVALSIVAVANVANYYMLIFSEAIRPGVPLPFSLFVALACVWIATGRPALLVEGRSALLRRSFVVVSVSVGLLLSIAFPLAQMWCFGKTDYRRPGDVAVVFGSRVYANGEPSLSLHDRVLTGCRLYHEGLVHKMIVSGGPGDGDVHETEAMRALAVSTGVAADDVWIDTAGLNTLATVRNSVAMMSEAGLSRALAVSHFYHLPRIKMAYQRHGLEVYTVPAEETRTLLKLPQFVAREVAAFWFYYLRPLASRG